MAFSTKSFTLTSSAYQDVSEGASSVWFEVPNNPQQVNDVRVHGGTSLPSASTVDYYKASPTNYIGNQNQPESFPMNFEGLAPTDRVYLRMDTSVTLTLTVFRK